MKKWHGLYALLLHAVNQKKPDKNYAERKEMQHIRFNMLILRIQRNASTHMLLMQNISATECKHTYAFDAKYLSNGIQAHKCFDAKYLSNGMQAHICF